MNNLPECFPCIPGILTADCVECMTVRKYTVSIYNKDVPSRKARVLFRNMTWKEASSKCDELNIALGHTVNNEEIFSGNCKYIAMFD